MTNDQTAFGPSRHEVRVDEYTAPRTPDDGPPDATRIVVVWQEADGTPVTDQDRIAALEAKLTQEGKD